MKRHFAFALALAGAVAVGRMLSPGTEPTRTITTTTTALDEAALRTMIRGTIRDELRSHTPVAADDEPAPVVTIEEATERPETERPEHVEARARAERLVTAALAAGVWRDSDFDAFDAATRELSGPEKMEAMRPLAIALNAQRVKIVR